MKRSPFINKIAAVLLLFIFGFILAEKVMHSHEVLHGEHTHHTIVQKDAGCKICDFQLIPETDLVSLADYIETVFYFRLYCKNQKEGFILSPVFLHAERGPPSLV